MTKEDLIHFMFRASHTPGGLLFAVSDVDRARRAFLVAKRDEPEIGGLEFLPVGGSEGNLVVRPTRRWDGETLGREVEADGD